MRDDIGLPPGEMLEDMIDLTELRRDTLLSVADIARNAFDETADFDGRGKVLEACDKVSNAFVRIRRELACEQAETVHENEAAQTHRTCFDGLEDKCGLRLNVFCTAERKKFIGVRKAEIDSPHNHAHLYEADATRDGRIEFKRDGDLLATVDLNVHRTHVNKIVCHVLGDIIGESIRRRRLRKKNRAAKRSAEGLK